MKVVSSLTLYLLPVGARCPLPYWLGRLPSGASSPTSSHPTGSDSDWRWHVSQVNDSLYSFYTPKGKPRIQIVFFHGLQFGRDYSNSHVSTWKSQDGSCIWPQTWLVEDFPRAHVLSVCYPGLEKWSNGSVDVHITGENLVWDLLQVNIGSSCPVVLVGHSFGGLVIRQLCCHAHDILHRTQAGPTRAKLEAFLYNIKGIFFYSTPHQGSNVFTKLKKHFRSPLLTKFEVLATDEARMKSKFDQISRSPYDWSFAGLCETLPTNLGPFVDFVVPEASARGYGDDFNLLEETDHFSICRPVAKKFRNFSKLSEFIYKIVNGSKFARAPLRFTPDPKYVVIQSTMMEIRTALEDESAGSVVTLSGGPGQGKSSMARYLALCYKDASTLQDNDPAVENLVSDTFLDGVVFLTCGQHANSRALLFRLWENLGYELLPFMRISRGDASSSSVTEQTSITELSSNFLSIQLGERLLTEKVLIVLDDVWEENVIESLLFPGKWVKYLITTQVQQLWKGSQQIRLNPPTSEEACQILVNHVYGRHPGGSLDITPALQDAVDAVVEKADRHPLVLANMATSILSGIEDEDADPLEEWRNAVKHFDVLIQNEEGKSSVLFNQTYPRSMHASMTMALGSLPQNEQTLLLVASIFKSQPIPEVVFKLFFERLHGTLARFSSYKNHLKSNNFIQIDRSKGQWSTDPKKAWSLHSMRQLFIAKIKETELEKIGEKLLECNIAAEIFVELLLLYGQDKWRDKAANTLGIPMRQIQNDSFQSGSFLLAPIRSFVWLLHVDTDEAWKARSHQLAGQVLHQYIHCHELDDNSVSILLSTTETIFYTVEALEVFSVLNPPRVVIPKTIRALVNLLETNLVNSQPAKVSAIVVWLLAQDFGDLPDSKLEFRSISKFCEKLLALSGPDGSPAARQFALGTFGVLMGVVRNRPSIGLFPHFLERLFACLAKDRVQLEQEMAVNLVGIFAYSDENRMAIGQFPNLIERLVELWAEDVSRSEKLLVLWVLPPLLEDGEILFKIGRCPNFFEGLVALLVDCGLPEAQVQAALLLETFLHHEEFTREIGQIPHVMQRLLALLEKDVSQAVQENAATAMTLLTMNPANRIKFLEVPNIFERLVELLNEDVTPQVRLSATKILGILCWDTENQVKIGQLPNAVDRLVALLNEDVHPFLQTQAALTLAFLCLNAENQIKVGQFPNAIDKLVALLADEVDVAVRGQAALALAHLCLDVGNRMKVGQCPKVVEGLAALLAKDVRQNVQRIAAFALANLCLDVENGIKVGQSPNAIDRLVDLLAEEVEMAVRGNAAMALANLCVDAGNQIKVGQCPKVVEGLTALLGKDVNQNVQGFAATAFRNLCLDAENRIKVGQFPNAIDRLVELLAAEVEVVVKCNAAMALGHLCLDAENRIKVGQFPNAIDRLVELLAAEVEVVVKCNAAMALGNLCQDAGNQIKVGQFPNAIDRLVELLAEEEEVAVKGNAAFAVGNLCLDVENRIKVGQCPHVLERLVALLVEDVIESSRGYAAWAIGNLAQDPKNHLRQFPNLIERLLALLAEDVSYPVQQYAAHAFQNMCVDTENPIKARQVPNAIDRLVALLATDVPHGLRCSAAGIVGNLCLDVENRIWIGEFPMVIERIVALLEEDASEDARFFATFALKALALAIENRVKIQQFPNVIQRLVAVLGEDVTQGPFAAETLRLLSLEVDGGDYEGELHAYEDRLVAFDPGHSSLLIRRSFAKAKRGDVEGAITDTNWFIESGGNRALLLQEWGVEKRMSGDLPGALADLDESLSLDPDNYDCLKHRGLVKFLLGDEDGARADAERALTVIPPPSYRPGELTSTLLGTSAVEFLGYKLKQLR